MPTIVSSDEPLSDKPDDKPLDEQPLDAIQPEVQPEVTLSTEQKVAQNLVNESDVPMSDSYWSRNR